MNTALHGLYAITPSGNTGQLVQQVEQALRGGARLIQYRDKTPNPTLRHNTAEHLLALTRRHRALLIINDDVALAAAIGADGVHLGKDDADLATARAQLGPNAILGRSCYNELSLACAAAQQGADYVAFGRFFPSRTKPDAVPASLELLQQAKRELRLPIAAIGGITADNAASLIGAGADMLAVVDGIFAQPDIQLAAQNLQALFDEESPLHVSA